MSLSLRLALRYLISKKSHSAVNIISAVALGGVAVATAAIVVVLSVFNGFSDLAMSHFSVLDPDLLITPTAGKVFPGADSIASSLEGRPEVEIALPSLTDRGLLVAEGSQLGVVFKGIDTDRLPRLVDYDEAVQAGIHLNPDYLLENECFADMAVGVAMRMNLVPGASRSELYVPRRVGRINPANPAAAFFSTTVVLQNVLAINQTEFDADHILVPLSTARSLLDYSDDEASAIELKLAPGVVPEKFARTLKIDLGDGFNVASRRQQHEESYRMIAIEKWVTFAMLAFILIIAAFNILSTLSLMVIEKRDNMLTLRYLGATEATVKHVFMWMGAFITIAGGISGMILGAALSWLQQTTGIISLSGDPSQLAVTVYPVRVALPDLVVVMAIVLVLSGIISLTTLIFSSRKN